MRKTIENLATSKITGGRRHPLRIRRKYEMDRYPNEALARDEQITVTRRTRGGHSKTALKTVFAVNLSGAGEKTIRTRILKVLDNPTNNDYKRRGVITRGALLDTEKGTCRVVSRPGQDGSVNAILVEARQN